MDRAQPVDEPQADIAETVAEPASSDGAETGGAPEPVATEADMEATYQANRARNQAVNADGAPANATMTTTTTTCEVEHRRQGQERKPEGQPGQRPKFTRKK